MADLFEQILDAEIHFPRSFAHETERPYGILYHNTEIPDSHDSNHGRILWPGSRLSEAIDDLRAFYRGRGLTPRVYHMSRPGLGATLRGALAAAGFDASGQACRVFVRSRAPAIAPVAAVHFERVTQLSEPLAAMIERSSGPRMRKVLQRRLGHAAYHLLCASVDGVPVAVASVEDLGELARVDDVLTDLAARGKGYARALVHHLVGYHRETIANTLYLYADNPTAIRIYREAGFDEFDQPFEVWSAWQARPSEDRS